ncbi:hypothetical protein BaRGS_00021533, partial [Batillaria attramentaria]
ENVRFSVQNMVSPLFISSLVTLFVTTSLLLVAFLTSNWLRIGRINRTSLCSCTRCDCGIWYYCADSRKDFGGENEAGGCNWFLSGGNVSEDSLPDWFKATQGLLTIATVTCVTSLLMGFCAMCAPHNLHRIIAVVTTITAVLLTISVSVFGAKVAHIDEVSVVMDGYDDMPSLAWSYWLAVAATLVAWATAVCFFFVCRMKLQNLYAV